MVGLLFLKEVPLEDSEIVTVSNLNKYHVYTVILLGIIAFLTLNFFAVGSDYNLFRQLFNTGFLVFGGGHVVLPLLQGPFINSGLVSKEEFLLGYGIAQAIPGPLFSFASYLGSLTYDSTVFNKLASNRAMYYNMSPILTSNPKISRLGYDNAFSTLIFLSDGEILSRSI